jgi:hypothetical protein
MAANAGALGRLRGEAQSRIREDARCLVTRVEELRATDDSITREE